MSMYPKNIVAAGLAEECLVQLGYCIGLVDPVSVMVNTYETGQLSDEALAKLVRQVFPLSPGGIIDHLKLRRPVCRGRGSGKRLSGPADEERLEELRLSMDLRPHTRADAASESRFAQLLRYSMR